LELHGNEKRKNEERVKRQVRLAYDNEVNSSCERDGGGKRQRELRCSLYPEWITITQNTLASHVAIEAHGDGSPSSRHSV
jgi:hypothetical protein